MVLPVGSRNTAYFSAALEKFGAFVRYLGGEYVAEAQTGIVKYTAAALVGAALACSGAVFQGGYKNIIASPSIMGVQSGARLGNAVYTLLFVRIIEGFAAIRHDTAATKALSFWDTSLQQLFAMSFAVVTVLLVVLVTRLIGKGRFSAANILFSGIVISAFISSFITIIQYYFLYHDPSDQRWRTLQAFITGNFDRVVNYRDLFSMAVILVPCLTLLLYLSPRLNVLMMGEAEAQTMGLNVRRYRAAVTVMGALMVGNVFAFCGQIGFVDFIVPQIARRIVGPDYRRLMLMSILLGAILMMLVYSFSLVIGFARYLNIFTSTIGCAMMIYSLIFGKGGRAYA